MANGRENLIFFLLIQTEFQCGDGDVSQCCFGIGNVRAQIMFLAPSNLIDVNEAIKYKTINVYFYNFRLLFSSCLIS